MQSKRNLEIFKHNWEKNPGTFAVELRKKKRNFALLSRRKPWQTSQDPCENAISEILHGENIAQALSLLTKCNFESTNLDQLVPALVSIMISSTEDLLTDVSLILCNIAALGPTPISLLISCDYISHCSDLLTETDNEVCENLLWGCANILGTDLKYHNLILQNPILQSTLSILLHKEVKISFVDTVSWFIRNLTQTKTFFHLSDLQIIIQILKEIFSLDMPSIDKNSLYAVMSLASLGYEKEMLLTEIVSSVVKYSYDKDIELQFPACRAIGNIINSNKVEVTQFMIDIGMMDLLVHNLDSENLVIVKETCWTISNLLGGSVEQAQKVLIHPVMVGLLKCLNSEDVVVRKEASWAMRNIGVHGNSEKLDEELVVLLQNNLLVHLREALQRNDSETIRNLMVFIESFLLASARFQVDVIEQFYFTGCYNAIENSFLHTDKSTEHKILNILEDYFDTNDNFSDYSNN